MKHLPAKSEALLTAYIRKMADLVGLKDWTITFDAESWTEGDNNATCVIHYAQRLAKVAICSDFDEYTRDEQRQTLVHELIHCHADTWSGFVDNDLIQNLTTGDTQKAFRSVNNRMMEMLVDNIASAIAELLPLPPWSQLNVED